MKATLLLASLFAALLAPGPIKAVTLADGIIARYAFDGNSNDVSGNSNDLTGNDPTPHTLNNANTTTFVSGSPILVQDRFGNSDSAYSITYGQFLKKDNLSFQFNNANDYTFSLWSQVHSIDYRYPFLFSLQGVQNSMNIILDKDFGNSSALDYTGANKLVTNYQPQVDQWYMSTVTVSGGAISYFIDGQLAGQSTITSSSGTAAPTTLMLGNEYWWFQGNYAVDDVVVYDRALSSSEVTSLYAIQSTPEPCRAILLAIGGVALVLRRRRGRGDN